MTRYDLGEAVTLEHLVENADGELTDAIVTFDVTAPSGAIITPTVTRLSLGRYRTTLVPAELDGWTYVVHVSGAVTDVAYGGFTVVQGGPGEVLRRLFTLPELVKWAPFATVDEGTYDLVLQLITTEIRREVGPVRYDAITDLSPLKLFALDVAKRMVRNTDGKRSTSRQIDDYTETDTFATETLGSPDLTEADVERLWAALGERTAGAFTIRPAGAPDPVCRGRSRW